LETGFLFFTKKSIFALIPETSLTEIKSISALCRIIINWWGNSHLGPVF